MHKHQISSENEKKTLIVIVLTVITMIAEVTYGYITNSMALLADGYHMGTHALALGLTYIAYILTRKFANSEIFKNGTDKIGTLAAYTSSIFLGIIAILPMLLRFSNLNISFGGTSILIIVGVALETVQQLESQLIMRHYKGFLEK